MDASSSAQMPEEYKAISLVNLSFPGPGPGATGLMPVFPLYFQDKVKAECLKSGDSRQAGHHLGLSTRNQDALMP
jgi:hypothetical protein